VADEQKEAPESEALVEQIDAGSVETNVDSTDTFESKEDKPAPSSDGFSFELEPKDDSSDNGHG